MPFFFFLLSSLLLLLFPSVVRTVKHEIKLMWWREKYFSNSPALNPLLNLKTDLGKLNLNFNTVSEGKLQRANLSSLLICVRAEFVCRWRFADISSQRTPDERRFKRGLNKTSIKLNIGKKFWSKWCYVWCFV